MRIELPVDKGSDLYGRPATVTRTGEPEIVSTGNEIFLAKVLGGCTRIHYRSRTAVSGVTRTNVLADGASLAVATVHGCFDQHVPLSLSPAVIWYLIVHEVAQHIKLNADRYADIFTSSPGERQVILVEDHSLRYSEPSDWLGSISLVRDHLRAAVTDRTLGLFLPVFTNSAHEDETALLVAFMDSISPYYEFGWATMCGIPAIELQGEPGDWAIVHDQAGRLAAAFPGLDGYFADLLPVLAKIAGTAAGGVVDELFWTSIYKFGEESGGPYANGWITAFFAHVNSQSGPVPRQEFGWQELASRNFAGFTTNQFPSHLSRVPFRWRYQADGESREIPMSFVGGVLGVDQIGSALAPQLGVAVIED